MWLVLKIEKGGYELRNGGVCLLDPGNSKISERVQPCQHLDVSPV